MNFKDYLRTRSMLSEKRLVWQIKDLSMFDVWIFPPDRNLIADHLKGSVSLRTLYQQV